MAARNERRVTLQYDVPRVSEDWTLSEEPMPESRSHDLTIELLRAILSAWAARSGRSMQVGRNLAVRWDEAHPNVGVDPDVYVVEPAPPEGDAVTSLRLWEPGHHAPLVGVEVVSASNPRKDYASAPEKYAACGVRELWVFDPELAGPASHGGPFRIQLWERTPEDGFRRVYAGSGPVRSHAIGGYLFAVDEGRRLRIADDDQGTRWWTTGEEAERQAKEAERQAKEAERQAKEAALQRVAELEAELRRRG